jgi:hypothetical protein
VGERENKNEKEKERRMKKENEAQVESAELQPDPAVGIPTGLQRDDQVSCAGRRRFSRILWAAVYYSV